MNLRQLTALGCVLALAACDNASSQPAPGAGETAAVAEQSEQQHAGDTITIKMYTDEKGNYFEPRDVTVKEHDVLRFELVSGVHNVNFQIAQNAAGSVLPGPSELLQLPGQTLFIPVTWEEGTYSYQCDPHALLGMIGTVTVK